MKLELISNSEQETLLFASNLAKTLSQPAIISLEGDLGAGKTVFARGFAKGLGVDKEITSPTFTILNEYEIKMGKLYHFDLYRLEDESEIESLGFDEMFNLETLNGFSLVEWAERVPNLICCKHFVVKIERIDDRKRKIIFMEETK